LKTTAHPQEAGYELIFWAIEDILELGLNRKESAALRRIIALGSQAFYDSLGEQGVQLLARRRAVAHARVPSTMPTQGVAARSRLDGSGSFDPKARLVAAQSSFEEAKVEKLAAGATNKTQEGSAKASADNSFADMKGMAISRNTVAR